MKTQNQTKKQTHLKVISMLLAIALIVPLLTTSTPTEVYAKTSNVRYITTDKVWCHTKPNSNKSTRLKKQLNFRTKVYLISKDKDWSKIKLTNGTKCYVSNDYLTKSSYKPPVVVEKAYEKTMYTTGTKVKLRKSPIQGNNQKASIKSKGTKVQVFGKVIKYRGETFGKTKWYNCKVTVAGKTYTGYIHRDNLTTTKPKNSSSSGNHTNSVPDNFGDPDDYDGPLGGSNLQG